MLKIINVLHKKLLINLKLDTYVIIFILIFPLQIKNIILKSNINQLIKKYLINEEINHDILSANINKCKISNTKFQWKLNKIKIIDLIEQVSVFTCKNFILSNNISIEKKINIINGMSMNMKDTWSNFHSILSGNNLAIIKIGKFYKVINRNESIRSSLKLISNKKSLPLSEEIVTYIHQFEHLSKYNIKKIINNLISNHGGFSIINENLLIITDSSINIRRIILILNKIDLKNESIKIHYIDLIYSNVKYIKKKIKEIIRKSSKKLYLSSHCSFTDKKKIKNFTYNKDKIFNIEKIISENRSNKLILIASNYEFFKIKEIISILDVNSSNVLLKTKIYIYPIKNNNAKKIAKILINISKELISENKYTFKYGIKKFINEKIRITYDENSNSLIISSTLKNFKLLCNVIAKLDKPKVQIYVEATILEISFNNNINIDTNGFNRIINPFNNNGLTVISNPSSYNIISNILKNTVFGGAIGGTSLLTSILNKISSNNKAINLNKDNISDAGIFLTALEGFSDIKILATPSMMTLDNEKTEMSIGKKMPIIRNIRKNILNKNTNKSYSNISYENVKLEFIITPHISNFDRIRLEIIQKINDIGESVLISGIQTAIINTKTVKTTVITKDQQTIVIGGLISYKIKKIENKIPILSDIPVLGWLFKSWTKKKEKCNLLILLTPYIIKDDNDCEEIYLKKIKEYKDTSNNSSRNKIKEYNSYINYLIKIRPIQKLINVIKGK